MINSRYKSLENLQIYINKIYEEQQNKKKK